MLLLSQLRMTASVSLVLALLFLLPLPAALAATIYVDGGCSLQQAFRSANEDMFPDPTSTPPPAPTPTTYGGCEKGDTNPDVTDTIVLTRSVTVTGNENAVSVEEGRKIILQGGTITGQPTHATSFVNMITVLAEGELTVRNVTIRNTKPGAEVTGAAVANVFIDVRGRATLEGVTFTNTIARSEDEDIKNAVVGISASGGGGITVYNSRFQDSFSASAETGYAPVVLADTTSSITIYRSVFIRNRHTGSSNGFVIDNDDAGTTNSIIISASTITRNTADPSTTFAIDGAKLRNVTVAYNTSGGITGAEGIKNSILYHNTGADCGGVAGGVVAGPDHPAQTTPDWGHNSINDRRSGTVSNDACVTALRDNGYKILGHTPDIDDDLYRDSYYRLEPDADAIDRGWDCEVVDQLGNGYGPNPCDLGAFSRWDGRAEQPPAPAPAAAAPAATSEPYVIPPPTLTPSPTAYPTVDGWMLFSDYEGVLAKTVTAAGVGIAHIIELGFISALDIWGEVGWGVTACHTEYSNGNFVFLDAAGMPREAVTWPAAPPINGMACTYIENEGTVVLLRADPWSEPPEPTPRESLPAFGPPTPVLLQDCTLLTRDMVNLRATEWGDVLTIIPFETTLIASEITEEFYRVTFEGQEGYVHRDWVTITTEGCA